MSFLPSSRSFSDINVDKDPEIFLRALNKFSNDVAVAVNARTIGVYTTNPVPCGNAFNSADVSRVVVPVQGIPNGASVVSTPIPLGSPLVVCALYGFAQDGSLAIPIPFVSSTSTISLSFNLTNNSINLSSIGGSFASFNGFIVIEYFYVK